jgi:hypothetical protein
LRSKIQSFIWPLALLILSAAVFRTFYTNLQYILEDWSHTRLASIARVLWGYPLYPSLEEPATDWFYMPLAALFYLPVALFAKLTEQWDLAILMGVTLNVILFFFAAYSFLRLFSDSKIYCTIYTFTILAFISYIPSLRYALFMVHPEIGMLSCVLIAITSLIKEKFLFSGIFCAAAAMFKQTGVIFVPLILLILILDFLKDKNFISLIKNFTYFFLGFTIIAIPIVIFILLNSSLEGVINNIWIVHANAPKTRSLTGCVIPELSLNLFYLIVLLILSIFAFMLLRYKKESFPSKPLLICLMAAVIAFPFVISSAKLPGADSNAYAPLLFFLIFSFSAMIFWTFSQFNKLGLIILFISSTTLFLPLKGDSHFFLWKNSASKNALNILRSNYNIESYFPWQAGAHLTVNGKPVPSGDGIFYEIQAGLKRGSVGLPQSGYVFTRKYGGIYPSWIKFQGEETSVPFYSEKELFTCFKYGESKDH